MTQPAMQLKVRPYRPEDEVGLVELWKSCELVRPVNDPHKDIARKMKVDPEQLLIGVVDGKIVASAMVGYDGHRGWLNYVAVHPDHRRHGCGRAILAEAERVLRTRGCPKINLQVFATNAAAIAFYREIGFEIDPVISMGKRLEHDGDGDAGGGNNSNNNAGSSPR